ncbi:indole-3-glycerol phosphate synthase TrpC [Methanoregula sp.]|uniref:indole-3-glycerol phosphate synthase TrpC n=1 Tax=Methanoregula sp. TaxID=2052170 RepID=UPI002B78607A|nr:indole-3-glycerol phosphate synthase TrpC [Methanoregula sp.]HVP96537.1 indole-3-glycerol phosphate synthase TrpC [Methanoregula sp.]
MILDEIVARTKQRVERLPDSFPEPEGVGHASLEAAIRSAEKKNPVIAEIKCASPSGGIIRRNVDMAMMAGVLSDGGCVGISVLTEPYFFGGSGADIARVRKAVRVPVLRKDFVIDLRQIPETTALGADAVLLIAAVLKDRLPAFVDAVYGAGLEPLVEVHNADEIDLALATDAQLIGINNRDLSTMTIDRSTTRNLSGKVRKAGRLVVSESGMRSADDVRELRPYCDAFLIGSSLMAHREPGKKLEEFVCA